MGQDSWSKLSKRIRYQIRNCQWCGKPAGDTPQTRLHCHHLGTRGHGANPEYRKCRLNLIVVCQDCHNLLEPFSKVRVKITFTNDLGEEQHEVACCGKGFDCVLYGK